MDQNKIWNELSEETRQQIIAEYDNYVKNGVDFAPHDEPVITTMEMLFGYDNLNPKPQIKTWGDIEKNSSIPLDYIFDKIGQATWYGEKVCKKAIATLKIAKLIEEGYGGIITDEEWKESLIKKYTIEPDMGVLNCYTKHTMKAFIAFHTEEQRDEFLKYNKQLCKDYFMM